MVLFFSALLLLSCLFSVIHSLFSYTPPPTPPQLLPPPTRLRYIKRRPILSGAHVPATTRPPSEDLRRTVCAA